MEKYSAAIIDRARDNADVGITLRHQTDDFVAQPFLEIHADVR